jgi:hypothetical protein
MRGYRHDVEAKTVRIFAEPLHILRSYAEPMRKSRENSPVEARNPMNYCTNGISVSQAAYTYKR